jgi:VWFA-related protein
MYANKSTWILAAACVVGLCAQAPQEPIVRVTTRLVEVNAVVRDGKGPVQGLTKGDFTILDNGRPQTIAVFSVNSSHVAGKAPAPLPPNVFTNIPGARHEAVGSATVVLLDTLHTQAFDQPYARQQFIKFLKQIRPEDRVAVYALGRRLTILNDFTNDSQRLLAAVNRYGGSNEGLAEAGDPNSSDYENVDLWPDAANTDPQAGTNNAAAVIQDFANLSSGELTTMALEAIADHLGRVPGRKSLVWITDSIPLRIDQVLRLNHSAANPGVESPAGSGAVLASQTYHAVKALNDANIAVYPVDARGLVGVPRAFSAAARPSANPHTPVNASSMYVTTNHDSMIGLAKATGGLPFYNTNDINGAIRKAIDDSVVTYTLGFYPASGAMDAKFHEIKVQVNRKGIEVRSRGGYLASADVQTSEKQRTGLIRDALWSPLEASNIGLAARVAKVDQSKPGALRITLGITPSDIQLEQKDGKWTGAIDYVIAQRAADGHFLNQEPKGVALKLDQNQYRAMMTDGLNFTHTVEPLPGAVQIRVVLLDRTSGKIGSVIVPLKQ